MKIAIFVMYYIYAIILIAGTAYLVFYKGISGWWFIMTLVLLQISPEVEEKSK